MIEILLVLVLGCLAFIAHLLNTLKKQNYVHMEMIRRENGWSGEDVAQMVRTGIDKNWPENAN